MSAVPSHSSSAAIRLARPCAAPAAPGAARSIVVEGDEASIRRAETALRAAGVAFRAHAPAARQSETPLDFAALVGRSPRPLSDAARASVAAALTGKRVLITGAGGSIGSELARLVAAYEPAELVLMERSENALFEIDRELRDRFPGLRRRAMLHDVVEAERTKGWLCDLRPHAVFHAAAHKHVPIMEDHPQHAVNNNVFGTISIADAALEAGAERFVMISTDKAVNPSSVMGATKRLAELYVRSRNASSPRTRFATVRFGNVLGSAGSVIPVWERQIAEGGPVTVTHPDMTRYFMTIPEAASLVLQAGSLDDEASRGADVFVLDMGEPIRILDLARRLIRMHGFEPVLTGAPGAATPGPHDMTIAFVGVRPGEKIHEELAHDSEQLRPTPATGVHAWAAPKGDADREAVDRAVQDLWRVRWSTDRAAVLATLADHIPTLPHPEHLSSRNP